MRQVEVHHGAATDVGRVREVNEDAWLAVPPVFAVADGMGGHEGGDVASRIAVEELGRVAERGYDPRHGAEAVAGALAEAQRRILEYGEQQADRGVARRRTAGTTVVAALLVEDDTGPAWLLANLGDSRGYRFTDGTLVQVSTDHSLVQELLDRGRITPDEAAHHPERNVITRALGESLGVQPDYFVLRLADVDRLLLCTDGVTGMLDDETIAAVLADAADPRDAADRLVAAAVAAGGEDNATAVVVDVVGLAADDHYDAARQRASLEAKLGAWRVSETWSCRGGDWFGIFGEHAAVLLPPSEKARVAAVWELVDDGAGFDETLDALISSGLRDLPGFVLVSRDGAETRIVLRGAARAHFAQGDDLVHVEGDRATTWVERTLTGVTRARLEVAEAPDGHDLVIAHGLVRVATAEWVDVDAAPDHDPDHDGRTRAGATRAERVLPGIPGQPPAPPVTARPVARLELSTGETVDVDRVVLVGRAPDAADSSDDPPRLLRVASPHQEISATHLEIRPGSGADHGSAVVTDLGSTNGTVLVQPGLPAEDLKAGVPVQLIPGAIVDLGDGVSIRVVTP